MRTVVATAARAGPDARGVPRLEPAGVPGPAGLRLVARADLVRPYGPARRDAGEPVLRRRRPRATSGRRACSAIPAARACIPDGLRRFATWAPLADPVLHPARRRMGPGLGRGRADAGRGPEPAAARRRRADGLRRLLGGRVARGGRDPRWRAGPAAAAPAAPAAPPCLVADAALPASATAPTRWRLGADGRSFSRSLRVAPRAARARPDPPLGRPRSQLGGKFFYLRELTGPGGARPCWSLGWQPVRHAGASFAVEQPEPDRLRLANDRDGRSGPRPWSRSAADDALEQLAAAAHQPDRPAAHGRAGELPGAGDRAVGLLPPHAVLQRPARRHLLRAHAGRHHRPQPPSRTPSMPPAAATRSPARSRSTPSAARTGRATLVGYQDARPCFIGTGTLAEPEGLTGGRMRAGRRRGPALRLRPDRQPAAARRAAAGRHASSCASSTAMPPTRTRPPRLIARHLELAAARPREVSWPRVRPRPHRSTQPARRPATTPALPLLAPTAPSWSSPARTPRPWHHVLANPLGHGAVVQRRRRDLLLRRQRPAERASRPATWTPCRPRSRPAPSTSSISPRGRIDSAGYHAAPPHRRAPRDRLRPRLRDLHHAARRAGARADRVRAAGRAGRDPAADHPQPTARAPGGCASCPTSRWRWPRCRATRAAACRCGPTPARRRLYFRNPRNDFRQGWAFVATSLARASTRSIVRDRFMGGAERDFANPYFVDARPRRRDTPATTAAGRQPSPARSRSPAGEAMRVAIVLGQARGAAQRRASSCRALARARPWPSTRLPTTRRFWAEHAGPSAGRDQPARLRPPGERLAALPAADRPAVGPRAARASAAAPSASATSCRTCCRCSSTRPSSRGGRSCCTPRQQFLARRRAAVVASAAARAGPASARATTPPTRISGCPT